MKYSDLCSKNRLRSNWLKFASASLLAVAIAGCGGGSDGAAGAAGPAGADGAPGAPGVDLTAQVNVGSNTVAATPTATAAWQALAPQVTVTGVTIASPPVVSFTVKDAAGKAVVGLGNKSQGTASNSSTVAALTNLGFTLAKLVPGTNGNPSKWVSYNVVRPVTVAEKAGTIGANASCDSATAPTWCGTYPTTDTQGTLVDNGDGSYKYTFYRDPKQVATIVASLTDSTDGLTKKADLGDLAYDATLTHRVGVIISGNAPGTGTNTPTTAASTTAAQVIGSPANAVFDFRPDNGAVTTTRNIVKIESCAACHDSQPLAHGGSRKNPEFCVTCHTDQVRYSFNKEAPMLADGITFAIQSGTNAVVRPAQAVVDGRAVGNFPNYIHKLHMGGKLIKQGYNYNNDGGAMMFNEVGYPQDVANCTKCHDGSNNAVSKTPVTANGDNWKNVPSLLACGSCHDGINFATGQGTTVAGALTGHVGGAKADNAQCVLCHDAATIPVYHSATVATPNNPVVKAGVSTIAYDLKSVTLNSSKQPVVTFQIKKDGVAVTSFATPVQVGSSVPSTFEVIPGLKVGPTFYVAYGVTQDNVSAPADFNGRVGSSLNNLLLASGSAKAGSVTGPDANGYFVATLTGTATAPITIPTGATMVTGAMYGRFEQVVNGVTVKIKPAFKTVLASGIAGNTARRAIVSAAKCNSCHEQLGTEPEFHNGERNDPTACSICHTVNQAGTGGWAADSRTFIHGIHGASKRSVPFTWHSVSATDNYSKLGYPGKLSDCNQCHLPNTVNFGANGAAITPNLLPVTTAAGISVAAGISTAPYIAQTAGTDYGVKASVSTTGVTTQATGLSLVNSPISSACFSCHDTSAAKGHMTTNGGAIYEARSTALNKTEACITCHGAGKEFDAAVVHK